MGGKSSSAVGDFVKLRPLAHVDAAQIASTFDQMARALTGCSFTGVARFQLRTSSEIESFTLSIRNGQAQVERDCKQTVGFELITTPETWLEIAQGKLAPIDAFTRGQVRLRGDVKLGQKIMRQLAAGEGRIDFC